MVTLNEEVTIASPLAAVWPLLRDPAVVAACIPGAQLNADSDDGVWRGSIRIKFGPTVAQFRGEATLEFDDDAKRVTLDGRGIDGRGASRALANSVLDLHAQDATTTMMKVAGEFTVTGPLETFVNAGGVHVARALLADFCTNIAAAVTTAAGTQANADAAPAAAPASDARAAVKANGQAAADATTHETTKTTTTDSSTGEPARQANAAAASTPVMPAVQPAGELSAIGLLWRVLLGWLKSSLKKGERNR